MYQSVNRANSLSSVAIEALQRQSGGSEIKANIYLQKRSNEIDATQNLNSEEKKSLTWEDSEGNSSIVQRNIFSRENLEWTFSLIFSAAEKVRL